jgi:hypothetical protein
VRNYIELASKTSKQIVLFDMMDGRFASRPYGWPPLETSLLVAQLLAFGEISIVMDGSTIPVEKAYEPLTTPSKWRKITVLQRRTSDPAAIQQARNLGKQVFSQMGPDGEDPLFDFLKAKSKGWQSSLSSYKALAGTGMYPGSQEITDGRNALICLAHSSHPFSSNASVFDMICQQSSIKFFHQFTPSPSRGVCFHWT